jgi:two-component system, NtrC family, sensor kinase
LIAHLKKRILYVDDTVEQRYAMRRILETEGYSVIEAGSAREALQMMEQFPALAVVDVRLPDMNGYDLTREIKRREPYLPVLQVSASFSDPKLRAAGLSGGADAYTAQPVHPSELLALIRRMLQTSEAEEALRFLAKIGPQLGSTLSLTEAAQKICRAMVPQFADECVLYIKAPPGSEEPFWSLPLSLEDPRYSDITAHAEQNSVKLVDSHFLVASLVGGDRPFGAMAFTLNCAREYSANDRILAGDLANRAALTLQNCILFASEQATRNALIQSEKLATAGRMSAAIAHEVNNPLEALTNLIYIIEKDPEATDLIRATATMALSEVTRIAHITRQTLGFYRELRTPANLDLSLSVKETVELYRRRLDTKQISVELNLEESLNIRGIRGEIRQVISNLLVNALESMEETGGKISIETSSHRDRATVLIEDEGPGIEPSALPKIFDPFFTTKKGTGTGLGLWVTHSIVEKHQGTIKVSTRNSRKNHGTVFSLSFPRTYNSDD